ncbi:MAG: putative ABC transporter permease [Clostridia bacterium]|nr:putative ABC transporter permease [Clostridia bacterium]
MLFYCIYFFIIGAFFGWVLECTFKAFSRNFKRAPGILYSPFCILYGIGTVMLATIIPMITSNWFLQFLLSAVILTVCEYITYDLLFKMYGITLWDYSDMTLVINKKVCFEFAITWGILGVLFINFILPIFTSVFYIFSGKIMYLILFAIFTLICLDLLYTNEKLIKEKPIINKV